MSLRDLIPWNHTEGKVPVKRGNDPFSMLQGEINSIFDSFYQGFGLTPWKEQGSMLTAFNPNMNVKETDRELKVTAELPGMDEKDIDVSISDNVLTLKGEKKEEKEEKDSEGHVYRSECSYGSFERSIPLPSDVEADKADASFKNGVLTLSIPRVPEEKSPRKKIEIKKA